MADPTVPTDDAAEKRRAAKREYDRLYYIKNRERILIANKQYSKNNPEKNRIRSRRYRDKNKDLIRARVRSHYQANREDILNQKKLERAKDPEKFRAQTRRYQNENREKFRAIVRGSMRRWRARDGNYDKELADFRRRYAENPEKYRAYVDAWQQANPGRKRAHGINRLHRIEQRTPAWVDWDEINTVYAKCPTDMHVDHIVPIVGRTIEGYKVSGLHVPWNLQYLTPDENMKKHNRMRAEDHALAGEPVFAVRRQLSLFDD
jgi:hypothetical protein